MEIIMKLIYIKKKENSLHLKNVNQLFLRNILIYINVLIQMISHAKIIHLTILINRLQTIKSVLT